MSRPKHPITELVDSRHYTLALGDIIHLYSKVDGRWKAFDGQYMLMQLELSGKDYLMLVQLQLHHGGGKYVSRFCKPLEITASDNHLYKISEKESDYVIFKTFRWIAPTSGERYAYRYIKDMSENIHA